VVDFGAISTKVGETIYEQLQERLEVRVWGVGVWQLRNHCQQLVVSDFVQSD
jgi:hypothetical protein